MTYLFLRQEETDMIDIHNRLSQPFAACINNEWIYSPICFDVTNPATGETITTVPNLGIAETEQAIEAAATAFESWSITTPKERSKILHKWFLLITEHTEAIAHTMTLEQGKPIAEARGEVSYGASFVEWFAEEAKRSYGETIPSPAASKRLFTIKQPIGVVAAITPWNFPVAMVTRKLAPAIAAGCTVVLKPAAETPLCALLLMELAIAAGLPKGVLNIITSTAAAAVGKVLTTHPSVKKVSFTGSTEVGKLLMEQSASTLKKLSLELGGNAPLIVFDDADIAVAVSATMASKFRNAGQTCVCANRIYVQTGIYYPYIEVLKAAVEKLVTGNGLLTDTSIGPLINREAKDKVIAFIKDAENKGAKIIAGIPDTEADSLYIHPTIITNCTPEMDLSKEEIFGPLLAVYIFDKEEDVIALANDTPYGLAAYFFTENVRRCYRVMEQLDYGMIGINEGIISHAEAPFGGMKQSGFGKEGSRYGLEEYLATKYVCLNTTEYKN